VCDKVYTIKPIELRGEWERGKSTTIPGLSIMTQPYSAVALSVFLPTNRHLRRETINFASGDFYNAFPLSPRRMNEQFSTSEIHPTLVTFCAWNSAGRPLTYAKGERKC